MADPSPIYPVAPRLKNGPKKPHVGPTIAEYKALHAQTIGPGSDEWWAKVGPLTGLNTRTMSIQFKLDRPRDASLGQALPDCPGWLL